MPVMAEELTGLLCYARVVAVDEAAGAAAGVVAADVADVAAAADAVVVATAVDADVDARIASYLVSAAQASHKIEQEAGQVGEWGADGMGVTMADNGPRVVGRMKDGHCSAVPRFVGNPGAWEDEQLGRRELLVAHSLASASEPGREDPGVCYTPAVGPSVPSAVHTRPDASDAVARHRFQTWFFLDAPSPAAPIPAPVSPALDGLAQTFDTSDPHT